MAGLPVTLRVEGRRCVVVGAGAVARRRTAALLEAGARVTVISPRIDPDLAATPVTLEHRPYRQSDLAGAFLVVVATDDPPVNQLVTEDAQRAGVLVNRADDPSRGDLSIPAHAHHGPITLAVDTGGASAFAAAAIRRQLSRALDPDWPSLIRIMGPYRTQARRLITDPRLRQALLRRLAGHDALRQLKQHGPTAFERYCQTELERATHHGLHPPSEPPTRHGPRKNR